MKKILLSLFGIISLGLVNFGYCETCNFDNIYTNVYDIYSFDYRDSSITSYNFNCAFVEFDIVGQIYYSNVVFEYGGFTFNPQIFNGSFNNGFNNYIFLCDSSAQMSYHVREISINGNVSSGTITIKKLPANFYDSSFGYTVSCPACPDCPSCSECESDLATCKSDLNTCQNSSVCDYSGYESQINTLSGNLATCQGMYDRLDSDYDLLDGNYNTCINELSSCIQNGGTSGSGDIQRSSLFINQVQHLGNKNIYIDIPLEYEFSYTNEGEDFELTVVGLEQDEEYLSGVINKQNYIPTTEDLSNVISNLGLFGGLLVVCLFVILVFYMIKKVFD